MTRPGNPRNCAGSRVERAEPGDAEVLARVIADAFFDLAVSQWLVPDPDARRAIFPGYFRLYVEHAIQHGLIDTTCDRAAAVLWIPGTGPGAPPDRYPVRLAEVTGQYLGNFLAFDQALDRHHPFGTHHYHLAILAVRPDRQGQGIGTALLESRHAVLDDQRVPAYLEASDERTRRIRLRRSGQSDRVGRWRADVPDVARTVRRKPPPDVKRVRLDHHHPHRIGDVHFRRGYLRFLLMWRRGGPARRWRGPGNVAQLAPG